MYVLPVSSVLLVILPYLVAEWTPDTCPTSCVCHEVWSERLRKKLNSVDCKDRDINELDIVPPGAQALLLSGNRLRPNTINGNLTNIEILDISSNDLKIHELNSISQLFTQLPSLRALDLSNNHLGSLSSTLFEKLTKLETLLLRGNSIVYIERGAFQRLTALRSLDLTKNNIQVLDNCNWFSNSTLSLEILNLSENKIRRIQTHIFQMLKKLERLDLSNNLIENVHPDAFVNTSIRELYMDGNKLTTVPSEALTLMPVLTILRLNSNPISTLNTGDIKEIPNLSHVSLCNMPQLETIQAGSFSNLPNLKMVDIYENPMLRYIDSKALFKTPFIEILHIHTNKLRGLEKSLLEYLPLLDEVSIYNNPLHCNCLAVWLRETNITLIDGDKITCSTPHHYHNSVLMTLNSSQLSADCSPIVLDLKPESSVEYGMDATLNCDTIGAKTIKWILPDKSERSYQGSSASLDLTRLQHSDDGLYTCIAETENNKTDSQSTLLRVVHSPFILTASAVSQTFVALKWNLTVGSILVSYTSPHDQEDVNIYLPEDVNDLTIENLVTDTTYVFCIFYHYRSEHTCITIRTLPSSRSDIGSSNNQSSPSIINNSATKTMLACLSAACVVLVLCGVLSVTYRKCARYKKAKIMYQRQLDECLLEQAPAHIRLDQCYNPTTIPLCDSENT